MVERCSVAAEAVGSIPISHPRMTDQVSENYTYKEDFQKDSQAFDKAVKSIVASYFQTKLEHPWLTKSLHKISPRETLESISAGACLQMSAFLTYRLESLSLTNRSFILTSSYPPEDGFKTQQRPFPPDRKWNYHSYSISEFKSGTWFALSPANLKISNQTISKPYPLIANSFGLILSGIQNIEGGDWGNESEILSKYDYWKPRSEKSIQTRFPEVAHLEVGEDGKLNYDNFLINKWQEEASPRLAVPKVISYLKSEH